MRHDGRTRPAFSGTRRRVHVLVRPARRRGELDGGDLDEEDRIDLIGGPRSQEGLTTAPDAA